MCHARAITKEVLNTIQYAMYQRKVDLDMLSAVKIKFADVSSVSPSLEQRFLQDSTRAKIDTFHVVPLRRRRPKLVLTDCIYLFIYLQI